MDRSSDRTLLCGRGARKHRGTLSSFCLEKQMVRIRSAERGFYGGVESKVCPDYQAGGARGGGATRADHLDHAHTPAPLSCALRSVRRAVVGLAIRTLLRDRASC